MRDRLLPLLLPLLALSCDDGGSSELPLDSAIDHRVYLDRGGLDRSLRDLEVPDLDPALDLGFDEQAPPQDAALELLPDLELDLCREVLCEIHEICDPNSGLCRPQPARPGGACERSEECAEGECRSEEESRGAYPGGLCRLSCSEDRNCLGGLCQQVGGGNICLSGCDLERPCREGWICLEDHCIPDCRVAGCSAQESCDPQSGRCGPPGLPCRYDCEPGSSCEEGRCLRVDGSCESDYHCPRGLEICFRGRCVPREFSACGGDEECAPVQRCIAIETSNAFCRFACELSSDCPLDRSCRDGICEPLLCDEPLGICPFEENQGSCMPQGEGMGICTEAGNSPLGGACDEQALERGEEALRCVAGAVCYGDPDPGLSPARGEGRGRCVGLCLPSLGDCGLGPCIDFSIIDDPGTPGDESIPLGLCLPGDCEMGSGACGEQRCRPYSFSAPLGLCGPVGEAQYGEICQQHEDCAGEAWCGNVGGVAICMQICKEGLPCPEGERCILDEGWSFGVCR